MLPSTPKPITYYLLAITSGIITIACLVGFVAALFDFGKSAAQEDAAGQLGHMALAPFLIVYLMQVGVMLFVLWIVLQKVKAWDKAAITVSVVLAPILFIIAAGAIQRVVTGKTGEALPGAPVAPILVTLMYGLFAGVVAYNDIKYRKPTYINGVQK